MYVYMNKTNEELNEGIDIMELRSVSEDDLQHLSAHISFHHALIWVVLHRLETVFIHASQFIHILIHTSDCISKTLRNLLLCGDIAKLLYKSAEFFSRQLTAVCRIAEPQQRQSFDLYISRLASMNSNIDWAERKRKANIHDIKAKRFAESDQTLWAYNYAFVAFGIFFACFTDTSSHIRLKQEHIEKREKKANHICSRGLGQAAEDLLV